MLAKISFAVLTVIKLLIGTEALKNEILLNDYHDQNQKPFLTISKHLPEIFQSSQFQLTATDCTHIFVKPTNQISQVQQLHPLLTGHAQKQVNLILTNLPNLNSRKFRILLPITLKYTKLCSIVMYLEPVVEFVLQHEGSHYFDFISHIPGDTVYSFHFLVEDGFAPDRFWHSTFVRRQSNVAILVPNNFDYPDSAFGSLMQSKSDFWEIVTPSRFSSSSSYHFIGRVDEKSLYILNTDNGKGFFWNKWKDLQGDRIKMGVPSSYSDTDAQAYQTKRIYSFLPVLMFEVGDMLNATAQLVPTDIAKGNGHQLKNGTWTSYIGLLLSDTIHVSVPFTPFPYQYKALQMSKGVIFTPFKFFAPLPKKTEMSLHFLIEPFDRSIWISLFISILLNVAALYFVMHVADVLPKDFPGRVKYIIVTITNFARVLIDQPLPDDVVAAPGCGTKSKTGTGTVNGAGTESSLESNGSRIIFLVWLLVMIVVGNLYKSVVISILVQPVYVNPPLTMAELIHSDFNLNFLYYKAFGWDKRLPWVNDLKHPVTDYVRKFGECLRTLLNGSNVCMFVQNYLYLYSADELLDTSGRLQFQESKDSFYSTSSFFGISPLNPQLNEAVDRVADVIVEGALDICWIRMQFHQRSLKTIQRKKRSANEEGLLELEDSLVDQKLMLYPILILISGLVVACLFFMLENIWKKFKTRTM